jgi:AraC-like DNA-binding protein
MFDGTTQFKFLDDENGALKTEMAALSRDIELWRVRSNGHEIQLIEPNKITYLLPISGRLDVAVSEHEYSAESGNALLFSPNRRRTRVSASGYVPYEALVVLMPATNIRRIMERQGLSWKNRAPDLPVERERGASLRSYAMFLGEEFARPATPLIRQPAVDGVAAILEELILDLASGGGAPDQPAPETRSAGADYVRRAEELMRARFDEPFTVADIAETLGIGLRSLQIAFQEHRGHAPREALTRIRLDEVRKRLCQGNNLGNISHIAMDCGFTHMGRFSKAYHSTFGELPSETARARSPSVHATSPG